MNYSIDEKLLIAKAEDVVSLSEKHFSMRNTDFLTPSEASVIRRNLPRGFEKCKVNNAVSVSVSVLLFQRNVR